MAAKGALAKSEVINRIQKAFGDDFICEQDKKVYVWANDGNNGQIQVAISLTCPKVAVGGVSAADTSNPHEWGDSTIAAPEVVKPAEISAEEEANIVEMMKRLGL